MKHLLFFAVSILSLSIYCQTNCESQRYITEVFSDHTFDGAIQYGADDPYGLVSNQDLFFDVYQPLGDTLDKRPVIIHQFGGGYLIGWRSEPNIPTFADEYTKRGFVFISIDYRIGFNPLDASSAERAVYRGILDLKAALRFIVDNADTYGIDTNNIFLTGTSAGSISAMGQTYMVESDRTPSTYGSFLEPTDLGCTNCTGNNNYNNQEVKVHGIISNWGAVIDTSIINLAIDPTDNVPLISFHGTNDNAVFYVEGSPFSIPYFPNLQGSFLIHKRMETQGIKNKLVPLVGSGHEPQLLNPNITDTILKYGCQFLYEIMQGEIEPIVGDSTVCLNDENTYTVPFTAGSRYCWQVNNGTILSQNQNQITILWHSVGTQLLSLTEINYLDVNKERNLPVEVLNNHLVLINYSSNDGLFDFSANFITNANYDWHFGDGSFGNNQITAHQYTDTGSFEVIVAISNEYCSNSDTIEIISDICPVANFSGTNVDSGVVILNNSQFYNNIHYSFGDGDFSNNEVSSHTYSTEGTYTIQQIIYNDYCIDTFEITIEIKFCAEADFDFISNGLIVDFTNNSSNGIASFWNFDDGSTNGTNSPQHSFASSGTYQVVLIVYNESLCSDTLVKTIIVSETIDTGVAIIELETSINLWYPNPTNGLIYLNIDLIGVNTVKVIDVLGKSVAIEIYDNFIDLSKFEKGIYFIDFYLNEQRIIEKIILN